MTTPEFNPHTGELETYVDERGMFSPDERTMMRSTGTIVQYPESDRDFVTRIHSIQQQIANTDAALDPRKIAFLRGKSAALIADIADVF